MRKRHVSTKEAAVLLGTTPQRVRVLAAARRIPGAYRARRGYHAWKIPLADDGTVIVTLDHRGPPMRFVRGRKAEKEEALSGAKL